MNSLHFTRKSTVIGLLVAAAILTALVMICSDPGGFGIRETYNTATVEGREKYLRSLGWEIDPASEQERSILIPSQLEGVIADYAKMQDEQGFRFSSCAGCSVKCYTYAVTNYPDYTGTVYAVLYVRGCRVIGGDIHAAELTGFMHGLRR